MNKVLTLYYYYEFTGFIFTGNLDRLKKSLGSPLQRGLSWTIS